MCWHGWRQRRSSESSSDAVKSRALAPLGQTVNVGPGELFVEMGIDARLAAAISRGRKGGFCEMDGSVKTKRNVDCGPHFRSANVQPKKFVSDYCVNLRVSCRNSG